ncbi:MAG TPA: hypothetical protein VG734_03250 [Lacunisphaera sp.]|nr:hypothetical protein [Lacunisphaera sp.]
MNRTLALVLLAGLCLPGCSRSVDPLDWKIQAGDPAELDDWFTRNLRLMPPELSDEVIVSFNNIRADTLTGKPIQKDQRVCKRVDGHTVRELLIEGHELANRQALVVMARQSDVVVRLLADAHTLSPEDLKKREAQMNAQLALQGRLEKQLKEGEARVAALRAQPAAK